jgi:vitamin B12/bleomycin/antimicrobial peptide transport system ATP-binding/permease protein
VLWSISGPLIVPVDGMTITIPGYMWFVRLLYALTGSWLSWRVGRPLIGFDAARLQRESDQ